MVKLTAGVRVRRKFNWSDLVSNRFSELVALISVSTTVFLFFHTQVLNSRIEEIQGILTASASGVSAQGSSKILDFHQTFYKMWLLSKFLSDSDGISSRNKLFLNPIRRKLFSILFSDI